MNTCFSREFCLARLFINFSNLVYALADLPFPPPRVTSRDTIACIKMPVKRSGSYA